MDTKLAKAMLRAEAIQRRSERLRWMVDCLQGDRAAAPDNLRLLAVLNNYLKQQAQMDQKSMVSKGKIEALKGMFEAQCQMHLIRAELIATGWSEASDEEPLDAGSPSESSSWSLGT